MRRVTLMLMTMLLGASALPASSLKDIIKPGVVDMTRLFDEYASKSKAAQDLREKKAKFAAEVRQQAELIKKMEQELKGLLAGMSDSEKRRRIAEIEFKKAELTRLIAQRNNELATEEKDLSKPILKDIYEAIRAVANKQGVKIVFDARSQIAYHDISLDLTDLVLNRLRLIMVQKKQY